MTEVQSDLNEDEEIRLDETEVDNNNDLKYKLLVQYVQEIERNLRKSGSKIKRGEILGFLMENMSETLLEVKNVDRNVNKFQLSKILGDPVSTAVEIKAKYTIDYEIEEEENELEIEEGIKGKIRYHYHKLKRKSTIKKVSQYKKRASKNPKFMISYMRALFGVHLIYAILAIYMIIYSLNAIISISTYGPSYISSLFNRRYAGDSFLWSYNSLIFNNIVFLLVSILITANTRNKIIKSTPGMKEMLRTTKFAAIINLINHITFSVFLGIGSSLYYLSTMRTVNGVDFDTGIIVIIVTSILQLASIIILFKFPKPLLGRAGIKHKKGITNEVKKQNRQNILIFLSSLLKIASYFVVISTISIAISSMTALYRAYIDNRISDLFTSRNTNYQIAFYGGIIYLVLIIIVRKITDENVRRGFKKSIKRTVLFQTFNMTLFNVYLILGTFLIENYGSARLAYMFTLQDAIISAIIYYGHVIIIMLLNWKLLRVSKIEKKKINKIKVIIVVAGILLGLYLIYLAIILRIII